MFVSIYGAEAGDLVLRCLALGGVYVGGGIAPKILPALKYRSFMRAFTDKARFAPLLAKLDVAVCLDPELPSEAPRARQGVFSSSRPPAIFSHCVGDERVSSPDGQAGSPRRLHRSAIVSPTPSP